jgi:hypothetical protein
MEEYRQGVELWIEVEKEEKMAWPMAWTAFRIYLNCGADNAAIGKEKGQGEIQGSLHYAAR